MNIQLIFVDIIKLSLWDCSYEDNQLLSSLSDEDWEDLFGFARLQGLSAIFIDGLEKLSNQPSACRKLIEKNGIVTIIGSEQRWNSQMRAAKRLSDLYFNHGIRALLLKGLGLSLCYPNPKHRECNDIDIYLFGQYEKGNQLAEQILGAYVDKFSIKEDHIFLDGFSFDNHIHFLWPGTEINREFNNYLISLLRQEDLSQFLDSCILLPPPEFNYLFLMSHSYGHFMREGMAMRQMTDIACFLNKYEKELDWDAINDKLQSFHLKKISDAILSFIDYYFGLSFRYNTTIDTHLLERMLNDIMTNNHAVVYHKSKFAARVYLAKTAWNYRWRYNAFYEGGLKRFVLDKIINNILKVCKCNNYASSLLGRRRWKSDSDGKDIQKQTDGRD